jgi:antirestriction protein ArdC
MPVNEVRTEAEEVVSNYQNAPTIVHKGSLACYVPSTDTVEVPHLNFFDDSEYYYCTLFHELIHSTGASHRLGRHQSGMSLMFGSTNYAKEELVAELGSAFLCHECGIKKKIENQAAYINEWLRVLRGDNRLIISAASRAEEASAYILGWKPGEINAQVQGGEEYAVVQEMS